MWHSDVNRIGTYELNNLDYLFDRKRLSAIVATFFLKHQTLCVKKAYVSNVSSAGV